VEEYTNMAKKDTKLEEIRVRIPKEYKSILDEYCDTFGTTIQATLFAAICGHIAADLWNALARTREVVVKLNNFTPNISPRSQNSEESLSKKARSNSKKKRAKQIPEDFDPPREISEAHGLDHERAVAAFKDWAIGGGKVYADWIATYRNACRKWLPKFEGARKQLHQGVKVI
jgi:hypothetical protein